MDASAESGHRVLIFDTIHRLNVLLALFYRRLGYRVYCVALAPQWQNTDSVQRLAERGIRLLAYEHADSRLIERVFGDYHFVADALYEKLIAGWPSEALVSLFGPIPDAARRIRIALVEHFRHEELGRLQTMLFWAQAFARSEKTASVSLFHSRRDLLAVMAGIDNCDFPNRCPVVFGWIRGLRDIGHWFGAQLKRYVRYRRHGRRSSGGENRANISDHTVCAFAHKGINYGNLYRRDHIFSAEPEHPLNPDKVLVVDLAPPPSDERAINGEPYHRYSIAHNDPAFVGGTCRFVRWLAGSGRKMLTSMFADRRAILRLRLCYSAFLTFHSYQRALQPLRSLRIAIVIYDFLFPKLLAVALLRRSVAVVSAQERFVAPFCSYSRFIGGHYLVASERVAAAVREHPLYSVDNVIPVGQVRTDVLVDLRAKRNGRARASVLVLDFHSSVNQYSNASAPLHTWANNLLFYQDIIKLATHFDDVDFVIRGKNDVWLGLPQFTEVREGLQALTNVDINSDYANFHVTYELVAAADVVIGRPTSAMDEALAVGIPVLICDYYENMAGTMARCTFDYDGLPIYVTSYDMLQQRLTETLLAGGIMAPDAFAQQRAALYDDFADGQTASRVRDFLATLYQELTVNTGSPSRTNQNATPA